MKPIVKKVAGALAVKEVIDRVQEARKPKRSLFSRLRPAFLLGLIGGVGYYLYSQGKLDDVIAKGKDALGNGEPTAEAPAAVTGDTTSGSPSTATSF